MSDADVVARLNQALADRYAIERELGMGGMATVYLAQDLKHDRRVALKVLRPELAAVVGADRFLAEIRTTANLQHPHILPLFDSGEADSFLYYVMPYVAGETLRDRLDREKQLPVDEAVAIAVAVANALQAAHDHAVIHRDIKPANILLAAGEPVVADFGIALALGAGAGNRLTETGLSLGTPYYMSPEQATGDQKVGPPADIYALGCVLYEMLVGDPPYVGSTAQAVLGKIIQGIPVSTTDARRAVPAHVDAAVRKALEKVPADRFGNARSFAKALADPSFRHGEGVGAGSGGRPGVWRPLGIAMTATTLILAGVTGWLLTRPEPVPRVERFDAPIHEDQAPENLGRRGFALAPDGSFLVYVGPPSEGGGNQLWVRRWDDPVAHPIPRTEGGHAPAVSPDGREVAFADWDAREVRVVPLDGGPVRTVMSDPWGSPVWGPDGYVYVPAQGGIYRASTSGGEPERVFTEGEAQFTIPSDFLPDGRGLFTVWYEEDRPKVAIWEPGSDDLAILGEGEDPSHLGDGYVVFLEEEGLMAARLDGKQALFIAGPVLLENQVWAVAASETGRIALSIGTTSAERHRLVWVDREGSTQPVDPAWTFRMDPMWGAWSLSPDGTLLAVEESDGEQSDIWVKTLPDGPHTRLTFSEEDDLKPHWTSDGRSLVHVELVRYEDGGGALRLVRRNADGTGSPTVVFEGQNQAVAEGFIAPGGEAIIRTMGGGPYSRSIYAFEPGVDTVPRPLIQSPANDVSASLSPDGRWLAYQSNEQGVPEAFVRPYPNVDEGKWPVSTRGGLKPTWTGPNEIVFLDTLRTMMAARVETEPTFRVVAVEELFTLPQGIFTAELADFYEVADGGRRFIFAERIGDEGEAPGVFLRLVSNLHVELRERLGG